MGIDQHDFDAIVKFIRPWSGRGYDCMILGDCTFHVQGIDLQAFRKICGFRNVETIDIAGNPTHKYDLTEVPRDLQKRYAVVIDAGTLYWCMDVMAAWRGALSLLSDGSQVGIYHGSGLSGYFGRAYYSLHPKLFRDFYRSQGYNIERMAVRCTRSEKDAPVDIKADDIYSAEATGESIKFSKEFKQHIVSMPADMQVMCMATRAPIVASTV